MNINWNVILPILQLILSNVAPALKQAALNELKTIDAGQTNPIVKLVIEEFEKMVAAA